MHDHARVDNYWGFLLGSHQRVNSLGNEMATDQRLVLRTELADAYSLFAPEHHILPDLREMWVKPTVRGRDPTERTYALRTARSFASFGWSAADVIAIFSQALECNFALLFGEYVSSQAGAR